MSQRRVAVTGLGLISPYGGDLIDFFERMLDGQSAIELLTTEDAPQPVCMPFVRCRDFDAAAGLGKPLSSMMERFAQLGVSAGFRAWENAGLPIKAQDAESRQTWACIWGSALGGLLAFERGYRDMWLNGRNRISPLSVVMGMNNAVNAHLSIQLGLGGLSATHAVACASSSIAIGEAFLRVRSGQAPVAMTGGSDATLSYGVLKAWEAMRVVASGNNETAAFACRPFASDRNGLVLGEGAAALVLEDWDHAQARGATIWAEVAGYGVSCDAVHLVRPEASGQVRAIRAALVDAALDESEIDYVNAHGTATSEGDPIEISALREVFGPRSESVAVSSTKSMHGHLLGAAGAIEALATVLCLKEQALLPTANLRGRLDPACGGLDHVLQGRRGVRLRAALSNSFAFGGSNAVLAFKAV